MHINKPFPRLTHSSLSQHASFVTTGGRRGCLQRLCFVRVRRHSATRRRGCVEPHQGTGRVPTSTPRPAAHYTGRRDGESERERGEGSRARMVWFIVWRTADPPSPSEQRKRRKKGRTGRTRRLKRWPHHWARNRLRRSLSLVVDVAAAASWHARASSLIILH